MRTFPLAEFVSVTKYPLLFLVICWCVCLADTYWHLQLYEYGVNPRTLSGLKGIICSPFIHGDFAHLMNNSLPVLVLGSMVFYFYKPIAWPAVFWIYIISGFWLWVGGRNDDAIPNYHFGASTLIYGFSTFLFFSGIFRKHRQLMMVSAFVVFIYGSMTYGMFPFDRSISWEGHLFGALSGILVAYSYRKEGPQPKVYQWPEEDEQEDLSDDLLSDLSPEAPQLKPFTDAIHVVYHYKKTEEAQMPDSKE